MNHATTHERDFADRGLTASLTCIQLTIFFPFTVIRTNELKRTSIEKQLKNEVIKLRIYNIPHVGDIDNVSIGKTKIRRAKTSNKEKHIRGKLYETNPT